MKPRLNLSLRRALMAAMAVATTLASSAYGGVVDGDYDLQYYLDFCRNKGMFSTGATNIEVFFKDGTSITNNTIPLMPNMDSYGRVVNSILYNPLTGQSAITSGGGTNLVSSQFVYGAGHVYTQVGNKDIAFLAENASDDHVYDSANGIRFGSDSAIQRLTKLVTEVAYTPLASAEFMETLKTNETWVYRIGNGGAWSENKTVSTGENALGGVVNLDKIIYNESTGEWKLEGHARDASSSSDTATPLDIGTYSGDSGSPYYAWDADKKQFVFVGAHFGGDGSTKFPNWYISYYNPIKAAEIFNSYTIAASGFSGADTIVWSASDASTGKGTLTQGDVSVDYIGLGSGNTIADTKGLTFSTEDSENAQNLQLQGNVNMGAGALTFVNGNWRLTELADNDFTLTSAGLDIKDGAEVTWELTGTSGQEIRKVGEGILTISGEGDNLASLVVGGGTTVYDVSYDESGNIIGCTLGNKGETRLNRTGGYAASSVRLEGGVAIIVLMADDQFKTNETAGDTFSFGNDGGLLNLNGHDLTWGVINQYGSGKGARIGNFTPSGLDTPADATFTYTGTGTFQGCFMDEAGSGKGTAQLSVVYNNAADDAKWYLTGNHTNAGGFTVQDGTMVLQGSLTPHVRITDWNDWTYATLQSTGGVTVKSGATFQLSHHALMEGNVTVEDGGAFILNQTANAASESISGSLRKDMAALGITSLIGNVTLNGAATMTVETNSPVATTMQGDILSNANKYTEAATATFTKNGTGTFIVQGKMGYVNGTVNAGGLVITDPSEFTGIRTAWVVNSPGFIAVQTTDSFTAENLLSCISSSSSGVLALTADQTTALDLQYTPNLYIGAYGDEAITYGTADATLYAQNGEWLLGGGTGTLNVAFKLTGDNDLIIGNEYSSGTVHLTNTANDFTGDIYIKGTGNMLTYVDGALGGARVALSYGNTMGLNSADQLEILKEGAEGVLALTQDMSLDLTDKSLSIGAAGDLRFTGIVTVSDDTYRFGGKGNLTLDTDLSAASAMELDGQGNTGSSVTFARKDAFSGTITAGGGIHLEEANSAGDIAIHVDDAEALAKAAAVNLQKGATLHTDGQSIVVNNLSAASGSYIRNQGETSSLLQLNVDANVSTSIANGVLLNANNTAALGIVKTGEGTLEMGGNTSWSGGLTIMEGTVKGSIANGGIGAAGASIYVNEGATLQMASAAPTLCKDYASTILPQKLSGNGEVSISNGNDMLFLTQSAGFEGTVKVTGNTRLYVTSGAQLTGNAQDKYSTSQAFDKATIVVENGSQARLTPSIYCLSGTLVNSWANYVISGADYKGDGSNLVQDSHDGALVVDCLATVWGDVTLADDAMIASWSANPSESQNYMPGWAYQCVTGTYGDRYGIINKLGGIIRGQILGREEADGTMTDLTLGGTEGITITADSANTFEDLIIANGNSKNYNSDLIFALRLDGGSAKSQVSQALGTGEVTLGDGLILRLAGTGSTNSDIVYTYENAINAGENATLQSYYITNRLTSAVDMGENTTLNLATANGGVLDLAGGVNGSGTLNVAAESKIVLGSAASTMALARSGTAQFSGTVEAGDGADITLASPSVVATDTVFNGSNSLTLRLGGTEDFFLGGITLTDSDETDDIESSLTLHFNFTGVPKDTDADSYSTLTSAITAGETLITMDLNIFNDIESGEYTLITEAGENTTYRLTNDLNGRLSLSSTSGTVILTVGADNRLYWAADGASQEWNDADANWYQESAAANNVAFVSNADVVLDARGAVGSSSANRETITLAADQAVGTMVAKEADTYYEVTGDYALTGTTLAVALGGDLKLSTSSATFTTVYVEDGSLDVNGTTLSAAVTAAQGGAFALSNSAALTGNIAVNGGSVAISGSSVTGDISLADTFQVSSFENATVTGKISLSGEGEATLSNLTLTGEIATATGGRIITASAYNGTSATTQVAAVLSGTLNWGGETGSSLSLSSGSLYMDGAVNLTELSVAGNLTVTVWNATASAGAEKTLGAVKLGNNATLCSYDVAAVESATTIGTLQLDGAGATIHDLHHSGMYTVNTLKLGTGVTSSTLTLKKKAVSSYSTVFNLGSATAEAGNFAGTIELNEEHDGSNRSAFIILGNETIAQNAVISLADAQSGGAHVGLGINVESASIAGLQSVSGDATQAKLFSGSISGKQEWHTGSTSLPTTVGDAVRTLTINTAAGTTHNFYGEILGSLNLVKSGTGTQKLLGASSNFNGTVSVQGGTLALGNTSALGTMAGLTVADGATLDLSAVTFDGSSTGLALATGATATFGSGATIALGDLKSETTYNIFSLGTGASLVGWDNVTLSLSNFTIAGVSLADMGRIELALNSEEGTFTYYADRYDLVWTGAASGGTWDREQENTPWTQIHGDSLNSESTYFANFDNVIFNSNAEVAVADGMTVGSITVQDNATATLNLEADTSLTIFGAIQVQEGTTLKLQGGEYALSDDIGSAEYTGTVALSGTTLDFGTAVRNIAGEVQVLGDTTITSNRSGEDYDNSGVLHINGKLSVGSGNTLTLDGNGRVVLAAGAEIALADGATMQRTAGGAYWLRGKISVAEGATASFITTDSIHFNYNNDSASKASIELAANSKLTIQAASLSIYDGASTSISLAAGSQLTFSGFTLAGYTEQNVTGSGKLVLGLSNSHGNLLQLGADFEGETYVSSGYFTMTGAQVGSKLTLGNGTEYQTTATDGTTVAADIVLEGSTKVHANSAKSISYTGSVTGHTYQSAGSATHTFNGVVDLTAFNTEAVANVFFNAKTDIDTLTVDFVNSSNVGAKVNAAGETTIGTFAISNNTTANFSGATTIDSASFTGGTSTFNGATTLTSATFGGGTVNFATNSLTMRNITRNSGNINFKLAADTSATTYSIGAISGGGSGTLTVDENVKLTATSIEHAGAGGGGNLSIAGELNVTGTLNLSYGWGESIAGTGKLNVGGNAQFTTWGATTVSIAELNIAGNLGLGSYGTAHNFNLTGGTTTVKGSVSISQNHGVTNLNISGGSLVMQGGATMSAGSTTLSSGKLEQAGGSSTISNTFTMSGGTLAVSGGSLSITSTPTGSVASAVEVSGGSLTFATQEAAVAVLGTTGGVSVSGGVLDLSAITFTTETTGALTLANTANITVGTNGMLDLGALEADSTYYIFSGGAPADWESLQVANFALGGTALANKGRVSLTLDSTDDGYSTFSYTILSANLLWTNGSADNTWNTSSLNWDATGDDTVTHEAFSAGDSVIFNTNATVKLGEAISADTVTLTANEGETIRVSLDESAGALTANSIVIGAGATLAYATNKKASTIGSISGSGTIEFAKLVNDSGNEDWGVQLKLDDFTGMTYVKAGKFDLYKATAEYAAGGTATESTDDNVAMLGGTLHLGSGAHMQISSGKSVILNANMVLEPNTTGGADDIIDGTEIHNNGSASLTVNGTVTGDGTWRRKGGGTLTFNNTVDLGGFNVGVGTNTFTAATTLDTLTVTGGTNNFNGTTSITTATISGGTVNFSNTASITTATISGGTVKATGATFGIEDGTITLSGGSLELNRPGTQTVGAASITQTVGSTIVVDRAGATADAPLTSYIKNTAAGESMIRDLAAVEIKANNTLELQQTTWNTIWQIGDLSGAGNLTWKPATTHDYTSRLILSGDGSDYTGTISVERPTGTDYSARPLQAFLELASDAAAHSAYISLATSNTNNPQYARTALAINTTNATIQGLTGDAYAHLYAGAARADSTVTTMPASTAANTLTIAGNGGTFAGTVGTSSDTARLSLAMTGAGTQTFSGQAYLGNVSVSNGKLALTTADVNGNISVSGGVLDMDTTYTLGTGQTLSVLTGTADAVQLGGLTLNGGALVLDADLLAADSAALSVGTLGLVADSTLSITINDIANLQSGSTYKLASGAWDGTNVFNAEAFSVSGLGEGAGVVFSTADDGSGLYMTYTLALRDATTLYWSNAAATGVWDASAANWNTNAALDGETLDFNDGDSVVFGFTADVSVQGAADAASLSVAENATVSLTLAADSSLSADAVSLASGSTLSVNNVAGADVTLSGVDAAAANLTKSGAGTMNVSGSAINALTVSGGTLNLTADAEGMTLGSVTLSSGSLNFGVADGETEAVYTITNAITGGSGTSLTVASGATVSASSITYDTYKVGSITVDGVLNLTGGLLYTYAEGGISITGSGEVNIGGALRVWNNTLGTTNTISAAKVTVGGNLELNKDYWGSSTTTNIASSLMTVEGTVQQTAGNHSLNITGGKLVMKQGGTFSTSELIVSGGTLEQQGGTAGITNTFRMTGGNLVVSGGSMNMAPAAIEATGGAVSVSGGELVLSSDAATALLGGVGSFTLSGTGELDLSAITFNTTESSDATTLTLGANTSFTITNNLDADSGVVIDLGALTADTTYQIFDVTTNGGSLTGWNIDTLGLSNFRIDGQLLSDLDYADIVLGEDGSFWYSLTDTNAPEVLYWVGGDGTWNTSDTVWDATPNDDTDANVAFSTDAHVAFNTSANVTLDGTISAASVTVEGASTAVSLSGGNLTTQELYVEGSLGLASGVTLTLNNTEEMSVSGITGSGKLVKNGSEKLVLGDAELASMSLQAGTTEVTGEVTLSGQLSVGLATLNIEDGAVVTANRLTGGNEGSSHSSTININGGELHITGTANVAMNNNNCTSNSILLAHWGSSNTVLTLNSGKLVATGAVLNTSRDSKGTFKALGGEAQLLGIDLMGNYYGDRYGQFDLGTATTGTAVVTLGSSGIKNVSEGAVVNLGEGTLKASADFAISGSNNVSLIGTANGTKFDTNGHNITVNTVLTSAGKVVKEGAGKLIMTAANTYSNSTTISGGTLELQGAGQVGAGDVSIAAGAELTAATTATEATDDAEATESETWAVISSTSDTAAATVSGASVTQTETTKTLSIASRSTDGTKGTMTNSLVQIAADASLTVDSMIISDSSRLSGTPATFAARAASGVSQLTLTNSVVELGEGNAKLAGTEAVTLGSLQAVGTDTGNTGAALTLSGTSNVLTIDSDALSSLVLTSGTSFVVDFSSLLTTTALKDVDFVAVNFSDVSYADDFWTNATTSITGMVGTESMVGYYMPATPDVGVYFDVRSIPEPTSTTLSILALAALAARRRRR